MRRGIALSVSAALGLIVMASGCGSAQPDSSATYTYDAGQAGVTVDTADLRAAKAAAGIEPCPRSDLDATADDGDMPALVLPCLGGGDDVNLAGLGTPTVLNLWAQYCAPCREEAPRFQEVYEAARGSVSVVGVDWQEPQPGRAIALADELGLTYPQLADPEGATRAPLRVQALPMTVFVKADGTIAFIHPDVIRSTEQLVDLIDQHLDVKVRL